MSDVRGYLETKGLQLKQATADEVHLACPFCAEDEGKRGRLYVNVDPAADIPGLYHCKLCDARGALRSLMRHFGDSDDKAADDDDDHRRYEMLQAAAAYYHERMLEQPVVYDWLRSKRGLSLETIIEHQLGWADGGLSAHLRELGYKLKEVLGAGLAVEDQKRGRVVDSLVDMVAIPYHTAGNVTMIRGRTFPYKDDFEDHELKTLGYTSVKDGPKYKTPHGIKGRLFNSSAAWDVEELYVTEGEFDALVLTERGFPAIGVPGANSWQDSWDGYVSSVKRLYVCFDNDKPGKEAAAKLKDRFGPRVRLVEMPAPVNGKKMDPTNFFVSGRTVDDFRDLVAATDKGGLLVTVDQAVDAHAEMDAATGVRFGVEDLDTAIAPGLLPSQLVVTIAKTGAGKTIWVLNAMQRMAAVQPDLKFLFVSLEQTRWEWFERARRIYRFYNAYATDNDVADYWRDRLMLVDKNQLSQVELHSVLDDYEHRVGQLPDVVFLDYLGYWARGFKGERYERTSEAVMALKEIAKDRRIRIAAPHQVSRMTKFGEEPDADAGRDSGVIEETADFMFTLWSSDHMMPKGSDEEQHKTGEINMRIGKSRSGGRGYKVRYQFAPLSLTLVPYLHNEPANATYLQRARNELHYESRMEDWETAQLRHRGDLPADLPQAMAPAVRGPSTFRPRHHQLTMVKGGT